MWGWHQIHFQHRQHYYSSRTGRSNQLWCKVYAWLSGPDPVPPQTRAGFVLNFSSFIQRRAGTPKIHICLICDYFPATQAYQDQQVNSPVNSLGLCYISSCSPTPAHSSYTKHSFAQISHLLHNHTVQGWDRFTFVFFKYLDSYANYSLV